MQKQEIQRKSILDFKDQHRLAGTVHQLQDKTKEYDGDLWLIWDILSTELKIAVCDYCRNEWFTVRPESGPGPRGEVRGLLVAGGACCTKCLDRLYAETADPGQFTDDEIEECFQNIAHWLLKYRCNVNMTLFGRDPYVKKLMQRFSQ